MSRRQVRYQDRAFNRVNNPRGRSYASKRPAYAATRAEKPDNEAGWVGRGCVLALSIRKRQARFPAGRRHFPYRPPPASGACGRQHPVEPLHLRPLEAPPHQWERLPMKSSLPYQDFPAFHRHPMVVVLTLYFSVIGSFARSGVAHAACRRSS